MKATGSMERNRGTESSGLHMETGMRDSGYTTRSMGKEYFITPPEPNMKVHGTEIRLRVEE